MTGLSLRTILLSELTNRKQRNAAYSLRAFARDLGVGSTTLSDYLAQKRKFSKTNLAKVVDGLALSPALREHVMSRANSFHVEQMQIEEDTFRLISDWHYLAILGLAQLKNNKADISWIASRLEIDANIVEEALDRLKRLGLLAVEDGKLKFTSARFTTTTDVPSAAIKKYHGQNLINAEKSLRRDPLDKREFGAITVPANPAKLTLAKQILFDASEKIAKLLSDEEASEVYTLAYQLFPVSHETPQGDPQ